MSRDLIDELAETLRERAASVPDEPALAGGSLARGRALRRRRRIATAFAPAVAAVVVATAATALTGGGDRADGPPSPAATPTVGTEPTELPPPNRWPYVLDAPAGGRSVIVATTGDRTVALPPGAVVTRLRRVGWGAVAEVRAPEGRSVLFVDEDGRARTFPGLLPPVAVRYDGTLLAATREGEGGPRIVLVRLPSGDPVATLPGDRVPLAFTGQDQREVLVAGGGRLGIWDGSGGSHTEVPGVRYGEGAVLAASPAGAQVAIADERELRVVDLQGGPGWTRVGDYREGSAFGWSPESMKLALVEGRQIVVVDALDGRVTSRTADLPIDLAGVTWADSGYVLALERNPVGRGRQRLTCEIQSGTCEPYLRRDVVLPAP
jgi:hypothetical protein